MNIFFDGRLNLCSADNEDSFLSGIQFALGVIDCVWENTEKPIFFLNGPKMPQGHLVSNRNIDKFRAQFLHKTNIKNAINLQIVFPFTINSWIWSFIGQQKIIMKIMNTHKILNQFGS